MGLATNCTIAGASVFSRKNYFYPDCPKNYQISQYDQPLCSNGFIHASADRKIGITRIHLEEDAGKSLHAEDKAHSYVDMNRVGVPLIEIVSEPEIRSPSEASRYVQKLRSIVRYLGVSDGNMEEGSLRCDVNVSLREVGTEAFGTKTEVKNLNSFKAVEQVLEYEIARQEKLLAGGERVEHQTLLWDADKGESRTMRSKEEAHDYRYFPEPDLLTLKVPDALIAKARKSLPELPDAKAARFASELGLPRYDAEVLTTSRALADYFEAVCKKAGDAKAASNWVMGEVLRELKERKISIQEFAVPPERLAGLIAETRSGRINTPTAKDIFKDMIETGKTPAAIIKSKGLEQISDEGALDDIIQSVIDAHPDEVQKYLGGKEQLLKFLVGQVMKQSKGKANPQKATNLLTAALAKRQ
jgi:aspartyl-tRNA(Asn)/glutamyl-tRNA(Gln) amidotransferase subunit B